MLSIVSIGTAQNGDFLHLGQSAQVASAVDHRVGQCLFEVDGLLGAHPVIIPTRATENNNEKDRAARSGRHRLLRGT